MLAPESSIYTRTRIGYHDGRVFPGNTSSPGRSASNRGTWFVSGCIALVGGASVVRLTEAQPTPDRAPLPDDPDGRSTNRRITDVETARVRVVIDTETKTLRRYELDFNATVHGFGENDSRRWEYHTEAIFSVGTDVNCPDELGPSLARGVALEAHGLLRNTILLNARPGVQA